MKVTLEVMERLKMLSQSKIESKVENNIRTNDTKVEN